MAESEGKTGKSYKVFTTEKHPEYRPEFWAVCRALYTGDLFSEEQDEVLSAILVRRNAEDEADYKKRKAAAFYKNYSGPIVDKKIAMLFAEQPSMQPADDQAEPDPWYTKWFKDVSRPGGQKLPFNDLLAESERTAQQCQRAWVLLDLPRLPEGVQPKNLGDQERLGALGAYAAQVEPESVWDWKANDDGELEWVLLAFQRTDRDGLEGSRSMIEEEFVYYTKTTFERYIIEYDKAKPPSPDDIVPLVENGPHSFGRVPLCMLELPAGLYTMGKLESLARAHMTLSNSLHWSTINSLFPTPVAFQGEENDSSQATTDPNRATRQKRSPYHTVVLGAGDRFEFIGPSPEPFAQASKQEDAIRDEMYRIAHMSADSVNETAAVHQQSAESKQADKENEATDAKDNGERLAAFACEILECVAAGRKDPAFEWVMKGMEEFGTEDKNAELAEAQTVDLLDLNSPSFQVDYKFKKAKILMGEDVTPERLEVYRKEFETNNPPEKYAHREPPPNPPPPPPGGKMPPNGEGMPDTGKDNDHNDAAPAA